MSIALLNRKVVVTTYVPPLYYNLHISPLFYYSYLVFGLIQSQLAGSIQE